MKSKVKSEIEFDLASLDFLLCQYNRWLNPPKQWEEDMKSMTDEQIAECINILRVILEENKVIAKCNQCCGTGEVYTGDIYTPCPKCDGHTYIRLKGWEGKEDVEIPFLLGCGNFSDSYDGGFAWYVFTQQISGDKITEFGVRFILETILNIQIHGEPAPLTPYDCSGLISVDSISITDDIFTFNVRQNWRRDV